MQLRLANYSLSILVASTAYARPFAARGTEHSTEGEIVSPCSRVVIRTVEPLTLSAAEIRLLCGDERNPPWRQIPAEQARYFLRSFLQSRGYYRPTFDLRDGVLHSDVGSATKVTRVRLEDAQPEVDIGRFWSVRGRPLTPKVLNDLERWVRDKLSATGHACPLVRSSANPRSGEVVIFVDAGPRQKIIALDAPDVEGLWPQALRRYDAFRIGEQYDGHQTQLTARRLLASDLVFTTQFTATCGPDGVVLEQAASTGPARLLVAGFGFNSERLFLIKARMRNSRIGPSGSFAALQILLSRPDQEAGISGAWYPVQSWPRFFLEPAVTFRREDQPSYETRAAKVRFTPGATYDGGGLAWNLSVGPTYELSDTLRGDGPSFSKINAIEAAVGVRSHAFEYYLLTPHRGFQLDGRVAWSRRAWRSQVDALKTVVHGETLWNLRALDPPVFILGCRGGVATTFVGRDAADLAGLPPSYRHFLGGSSQVRGFPHQALPDSGGALTLGFAGVEARIANLIPGGVQPFIFFDIGATGMVSARIQPPVYESPGVGVRWQSPIGPLRATAARGLVRRMHADQNVARDRWNFFMSFGEEF